MNKRQLEEQVAAFRAVLAGCGHGEARECIACGACTLCPPVRLDDDPPGAVLGCACDWDGAEQW